VGSTSEVELSEEVGDYQWWNVPTAKEPRVPISRMGRWEARQSQSITFLGGCRV
jgi:hypothetical protein